MSELALGIILIAAFLHAGWNFLTKKSRNAIRLLLSPYVFLRVRTALKDEWQSNKIQILIVGFLDLFTYLLVLFALRIRKVSYVAAAREISIVFSALLGIIWLKEKNAPQKVVGAVLISLGVVLIGLSR